MFSQVIHVWYDLVLLPCPSIFHGEQFKMCRFSLSWIDATSLNFLILICFSFLVRLSLLCYLARCWVRLGRFRSYFILKILFKDKTGRCMICPLQLPSFVKDLHGSLSGRTKEICQKYERGCQKVGKSKQNKSKLLEERELSVYECRDGLKRWEKMIGKITIFR